MASPERGRGWRSAPLRAVVWVLAAVYLGRVYYDNTLYDLRQLSTLEVVVRTGAIVVVLAFVYWNVAVANPDLIGVVWGVTAVFAAKVLLVLGVVRIGTYVTDRREYRARRRHERAGENESD